MKHIEIAHEIIDYLHLVFPNDSIAIAGSVADGTFKKNSDIDLLLLSERLKCSYAVSFLYKGKSISIFVFSKACIRRNMDKYLYSYHNMPLRYVYSSQCVYDSGNMLNAICCEIDDACLKRQLFKSILSGEIKDHILHLLNRNNLDIIHRKEVLYLVVNKIVTLFVLKEYSNKVTSKIEGRDPFTLIKKKDAYLYNLLKVCLPYHGNSLFLMRNYFENYILINY